MPSEPQHNLNTQSVNIFICGVVRPSRVALAAEGLSHWTVVELNARTFGAPH